jgi:hypothetical protein
MANTTPPLSPPTVLASPVTGLTVIRDLGLALLELGTLVTLAVLHALPSEALVALLVVSFGARAQGTILGGAKGNGAPPGLAVAGLLGLVLHVGGVGMSRARAPDSIPPHRPPAPSQA